MVNSYGTMMSAEHRALLRGTPVEVMRATGATMAILPRDAVLPGGQRVELDADFKDSAFSVWYLFDSVLPHGRDSNAGGLHHREK